MIKKSKNQILTPLDFMKLAMKEALKAYKKGEVPIGAVLVNGQDILAKAHNLREIRQNVLGHAELICLQKANRKKNSWRLNGCDLYVTLEPCPMCASALQQARIRTLYFATRDFKAGAVCSCQQFLDQPHLNHHVHWEEGLLQEESSQLLKQFFKDLRQGKHELTHKKFGKLI